MGVTYSIMEEGNESNTGSSRRSQRVFFTIHKTAFGLGLDMDGIAARHFQKHV